MSRFKPLPSSRNALSRLVAGIPALGLLLSVTPAYAVHLVSLDPEGIDYSITWRAGTPVKSERGMLQNGEMQTQVEVYPNIGALGAVKFEYDRQAGMISSWAAAFKFAGNLAHYGEARVSVGSAKFVFAPDGGEVEGTPFTAWIHLVETSLQLPADVNARYSINNRSYIPVEPGSYPLELKVGDEIRLLLSEVAFARTFDGGPFSTDVHFQVSFSADPPPPPMPMPIPEPGTLLMFLLGASALPLVVRRRRALIE
jgi:hypothetical protein